MSLEGSRNKRMSAEQQTAFEAEWNAVTSFLRRYDMSNVRIVCSDKDAVKECSDN